MGGSGEGGEVKGQAATLDAPRCLHPAVDCDFLARPLNSSLLTFQYKTEFAPSFRCSPRPAGAPKCRSCLRAVGRARSPGRYHDSREAWPISRDLNRQFIIPLFVTVVVCIDQCLQSATVIPSPMLSNIDNKPTISAGSYCPGVKGQGDGTSLSLTVLFPLRKKPSQSSSQK